MNCTDMFLSLPEHKRGALVRRIKDMGGAESCYTLNSTESFLSVLDLVKPENRSPVAKITASLVEEAYQSDRQEHSADQYDEQVSQHVWDGFIESLEK